MEAGVGAILWRRRRLLGKWAAGSCEPGSGGPDHFLGQALHDKGGRGEFLL